MKFKGKNLINLRHLFALTQTSLSEISGITELDIIQYENNLKEPSFDDINKLKKVFAVKSMYFYKEDLLEDK